MQLTKHPLPQYILPTNILRLAKKKKNLIMRLILWIKHHKYHFPGDCHFTYYLFYIYYELLLAAVHFLLYKHMLQLMIEGKYYIYKNKSIANNNMG